MSLVLDSSALLSWCFKDEHSSETDALRTRVAQRGASVPPLIFLEVANALLVAQRRGRISAPDRMLVLQAIKLLPLIVDTPHHLLPLQTSSTLAEKHNLTVYDATYLELSIRLQVPLATRDSALIHAAHACNVECIPA